MQAFLMSRGQEDALCLPTSCSHSSLHVDIFDIWGIYYVLFNSLYWDMAKQDIYWIPWNLNRKKKSDFHSCQTKILKTRLKITAFAISHDLILVKYFFNAVLGHSVTKSTVTVDLEYGLDALFIYLEPCPTVVPQFLCLGDSSVALQLGDWILRE